MMYNYVLNLQTDQFKDMLSLYSHTPVNWNIMHEWIATPYSRGLACHNWFVVQYKVSADSV